MGPDKPGKITASPIYYLFQPHISRDQRWIAFEAIRDTTGARESTVFVVSARGGPWIRITNGQQWDDKPVWSPDGKVLYFVSGSGGFYNVWGIYFDANQGKPLGTPFRVTAFDTPMAGRPSGQQGVLEINLEAALPPGFSVHQ
jgi:tricorn protease-like protein